ncbi:GntR family transcriptional regulator [Azospirillum sp. B506]|uniref:GntR family transcriptional regulator n=1 Tax=Azospirillum sp. B506 TaxID=137721 RepID=UPI0003491D00|nr:GntR family transcriptional regulator [Azospirillum sp. B506]
MAYDKTEADQSVREKTYRELKSMILSGRLRPSERLSETRLAERLGVSRTPLREALMKLEKEGLVVGQRNIGYTVVDVDLPTVRNLLVVRQALDVCAAELACEVATDEDLDRIGAIVEEMEALNLSIVGNSVDAARVLELGLRIHIVIAEITRNDVLIRVTEQIYGQLQLALLLEILWIDLKDSGLEEHQAIANAIRARDRAAAGHAARLHVQQSLENMAKVQELLDLRRASGIL